MDIQYRQATKDDIIALEEFYSKLDQPPRDYFHEVFKKDCIVQLAEDAKNLIGFAILNFEPKYWLYKKLKAPEIQDVNVLPEYRQQGIATSMIKQLEQKAGDKGIEYVGISVGITKDFGPAQKLYFKLGYEPDGYGATYDREPLENGKAYPANPELALMLVKNVQEYFQE